MRWRVSLWVLAIAAALVPVPAVAIESVYSRRLFPLFQYVATGISNRVSFALFDVLLLLVVGWWLIQGIRDLFAARTSGWVRAALRILVRTGTVVSAAYLAFLLAWGFNYRRIPLKDKLEFDSAQLSRDAAMALAAESVVQVNALYEAAHREGWAPPRDIDPALADAFARARVELGSTAPTVTGRPKWTIFDLYFLRAGVAGMTDPYFLETFVASDLLPFERPFVVAHEWAHLAGFADEGDANFVAWLTCLRGMPAHRYSGWLTLYSEAAGGLQRSDASAVSAKLADGPRSDMKAVRDRLAQHINPQISAAGWKVYDSYLKANSIEAGTASYADVVRLILGTTFDGDWKPKLKNPRVG